MKVTESMLNITPLVGETLSSDEVIKLIKMEMYDTKTGPILLDDVTYISWDGDYHYGVLVTTKYPNGSDGDDYFMERTWDKVEDRGLYWICKPVYHKLLPVVLHRKDNPEKFGTIPYLVADIVKKCYFDNISVGVVKGLDIADVSGLVHVDKPKMEQVKYRKVQHNRIMEFVNGNVPAGDERWDDLLFGDIDERLRVFKEIRRRGHTIKLDGEKDSFGWVTCGIVMDGILMTSEYF